MPRNIRYLRTTITDHQEQCNLEVREQVNAEHQGDLFRPLTRYSELRDSPRADRALAMMIAGLAEYADAYQKEFGGDRVGQDGFIGPEWQQIVKSVLALLNGPTGVLHCGTMDGFLRTMAEGNGCPLEP